MNPVRLLRNSTHITENYVATRNTFIEKFKERKIGKYTHIRELTLN